MEIGAAGGKIKSPYHQMMRDTIETITRIGSRFGFTPSDRASLVVDRKNGPSSGAERLLG
jgi:phage terminase small subunit